MAEATQVPGKAVQVGAAKLSVFISYSRDDLDFSDQLDAALRLTGFDTTLDRHGISGGEDWKSRLGNLIRDADTIAFVLSPSSARSEICAWEVAEATRLGKRIIPVPCRPLGDISPPPQLADLNYIFFYPEPKLPGSGFGSGLTRLVTALNTDLEWLREHTRYLQRATEWDAGGRPANRLLSGADIATAKAWAARRPKEAPEPTPLHLDFIRSSESWETQQQSEERKRLQEMARAQEERAKALADAEAAQKREAVTMRGARRRQWIIGGGSALIGLVAVVSYLLFDGWNRLLQVQSNYLTDLARQQLARGDHTGAMLLALEALPDNRSNEVTPRLRPHLPDARGALDRTWRQIPHGFILDDVPTAMSPDGTGIVVAVEDEDPLLWDLVGHREIGRLKLSATEPEKPEPIEVAAMAFARSGRHVVTVGDGGLHLWDTATARHMWSPDLSKKGEASFKLSPDGEWAVALVEGDDGVTVHAVMFDSRTSKVIVEGISPEIEIGFSNDGSLAAISYLKQQDAERAETLRHGVLIWSARKQSAITVDSSALEDQSSSAATTIQPDNMLFSSDNVLLSVLTASKEIVSWDAATGATAGRTRQLFDAPAATPSSTNERTTSPQPIGIKSVFGPGAGDQHALVLDANGAVASVDVIDSASRVLVGPARSSYASAELSRDRSRLFVRSGDNTTRLVNVTTGRDVIQFTNTRIAKLSPSGQLLLVVLYGGDARLIDAESGRDRAAFDTRAMGEVTKAEFIADGAWIRITTAKAVQYWSARTGAPEARPDASQAPTLHFTQDGSRLIVGGRDGTVAAFEMRAQRRLWTWKAERRIVSVSLGKNGGVIGAVLDDGSMRIVEAASGRLLRERTGNSRLVRGHLSADARRFAAVSEEGVVQVHEPGSPAEPVQISAQAVSVQLSIDGSLLLTGAMNGSAHLWDAATGELIRSFRRAGPANTHVALSADNARAVTGSGDGTTVLWNARTGALLHRFKDHPADIVALGFLGPGALLYSASSDGTIVIRDAATGAIRGQE